MAATVAGRDREGVAVFFDLLQFALDRSGDLGEIGGREAAEFAPSLSG